jgi:hypothetical protein
MEIVMKEGRRSGRIGERERTIEIGESRGSGSQE